MEKAIGSFHYNEPLLKVFRIHPNGVRIEKANKHLNNKANKGALTWCGPYTWANSFGWWIYPGFDLDIICHEHPVDNCYTGRWGGHYTYNVSGYDDSDYIQMRNFEYELSCKMNYLGKQHYSIDEPEKDCISLWTGCVFQMPKDWALMIKSPTNIGLIYDNSCPACVQEGILEVDWMRYDIWTNFKFFKYDSPLSFRKDQDWPIAQIIPIHKSSYETHWNMQELLMEPDNQDCIDMYEQYVEYNYKKWIEKGEKDGFVFKKLRKLEEQTNPTKDLFVP